MDAVDAPAPVSSKLGGWGAAPAPSAPAMPAADVRVGELVDLCRRVSAGGSRAPGRRLHDELRTWLPTVSDLPSFAVAAATEEGLAVALVGDGAAEVPDLGLRLTSADGEQKLPDGKPFLDRLVDWPPAALRLSAGGKLTTSPHPLADLESGSVPGAAAVLSPAAAPAPMPSPTGPAPTMMVRLPAPGSLLPQPGAATPPERPARCLHRHDGRRLHRRPSRLNTITRVTTTQAMTTRSTPTPAPVAPPAPEPMELPAPVLSSSLLDEPEEEEEREPLPVISTEQPPAALAQEPEDTRPKVKGFLCSRGHLNDPRVLFCNLCGIRMAEKTGVFIEGIRPPLGLLVFDNGATVSMDADYLLGREPETDPRVQSGELRPLLVIDQTGGVSRHHAELRLEGWDVLLLDTGSANGTLVAPQGAPQWSSLVPGQPVRLTPGMAVRMGSRQFAFESPHGGGAH